MCGFSRAECWVLAGRVRVSRSDLWQLSQSGACHETCPYLRLRLFFTHLSVTVSFAVYPEGKHSPGGQVSLWTRGQGRLRAEVIFASFLLSACVFCEPGSVFPVNGSPFLSLYREEPQAFCLHFLPVCLLEYIFLSVRLNFSRKSWTIPCHKAPNVCLGVVVGVNKNFSAEKQWWEGFMSQVVSGRQAS